MTEEDTFRRLKRIPFKEMQEKTGYEYRLRLLMEQQELLVAHGWSAYSYYAEYNRRFNDIEYDYEERIWKTKKNI